MPTLTVTNPTLATAADSTEIDTNFNDVEAVVNAIDNDNIAASAGIATNKLAGRDYEFLVPLALNVSADVVPAASATLPVCIVPFPGDSGDGTYTITDGSYYITDDGTTNTTFDIRLGYANAGAWTTISTPVSAEVIVSGGANTHKSSTLTVDTSVITLHASTPYFLGLFITTAGTNILTTSNYDGFYVTLKVRRTDGLR